MKIRAYLLGAALLASITAIVLITSTGAHSATNPVPSGQLVVPAANASWTPGQNITLTTTGQDTNNTAGFAPGVTTVEWWLYADKSLGDSYNWSDQFPGNTENKIFLGESTTPSSGTKLDGTWTAHFTVPTNGQMTVTRDGQDPGGLPAPRTYVVNSGTYTVQSHLQNAWWTAHMGVETGKTAFTPIHLDAGGTGTPPTSSSSSSAPKPPTSTVPAPPSTSTSKPAPPTSPTPTPVPVNLVTNPGAESGTPPTCFQGVGWGTNTFTFGTSTTAHTGKRSLSLAVTRISSGDRKYLTTQSTACAPAVTAGKSYALGTWVRSSGTHNTLTVFRHTAAGWAYWTDLKVVGASTAWVHLTGNTPTIPTGTDRIAFGVSSTTVGTLLTDDYTMTLR